MLFVCNLHLTTIICDNRVATSCTCMLSVHCGKDPFETLTFSHTTLSSSHKLGCETSTSGSADYCTRSYHSRCQHSSWQWFLPHWTAVSLYSCNLAHGDWHPFILTAYLMLRNWTRKNHTSCHTQCYKCRTRLICNLTHYIVTSDSRHLSYIY